MKQTRLFKKDLALRKTDYSNLLFRDKSDLTSDLLNRFPNAHILGSMESLDRIPKSEIEILSVKYSKVGQETLKQLPNLKYVVCRSHGSDNISPIVYDSGIKVNCSYPTAEAVADFIIEYMHRYEFSPPYVLFGYGNIGKLVAEKVDGEILIITSTTSQISIEWAVKEAKSAIITIPPTHNIIDDLVFKNFKGKMVSISRKSVFNLLSLENALVNNRLFLISDTKPFPLSDAAQKNVKFTDHTAWSFNLDPKVYLERIAIAIDLCYGKAPSPGS